MLDTLCKVLSKYVRYGALFIAINEYLLKFLYKMQHSLSHPSWYSIFIINKRKQD